MAKNIILSFFTLVLLVNISVTLTSAEPFIQAKKKTLSLSQGDRYYGYLQLWYFYDQKNDWAKADKLQTRLDINDITFYKSNNHPAEIQKNLAVLNKKENKTIDDWIQSAQFQLRLNKKKEALNSLNEAIKIDPIRDDLSQLYFSLSSD